MSTFKNSPERLAR